MDREYINHPDAVLINENHVQTTQQQTQNAESVAGSRYVRLCDEIDHILADESFYEHEEIIGEAKDLLYLVRNQEEVSLKRLTEAVAAYYCNLMQVEHERKAMLDLIPEDNVSNNQEVNAAYAELAAVKANAYSCDASNAEIFMQLLSYYEALYHSLDRDSLRIYLSIDLLKDHPQAIDGMLDASVDDLLAVKAQQIGGQIDRLTANKVTRTVLNGITNYYDKSPFVSFELSDSINTLKELIDNPYANHEEIENHLDQINRKLIDLKTIPTIICDETCSQMFYYLSSIHATS
ncbi:MAG: hypothetical protein LBS41_00885 [Streptococcaceae bacterium]|jgi:hypothetical protein|nr:hypothetical protein [Streptococcaceae bacterium]